MTKSTASATVSANHTVEYTTRSKQPPPCAPMENELVDAFIEWGVVEALLTINESQIWCDAYLIGVENVQNQASKDKAKPSKATTIPMCTVVAAIVGEEPLITLSEKKNVHTVPLEQIQLKFKFDPQSSFVVNTPVQVAVDSTPFMCWKTGVIKMTKENYFMVALDNLDGQAAAPTETGIANFDIVASERMRPISASQRLSAQDNPFYRFALALPHDLVKILKGDLQWLSSYEVHKDFKRGLKLINVYYDAAKKALVCLAFALKNKNIMREQTIKRSQMLSTMHFSNLRENASIYSSRIDMKNMNYQPKKNEFKIQLNLDPKFIGLAIGKSGVNIQKARKIPGIKSLELIKDTSTFIIIGDSKETCEEAAEVLNFGEERVSYPNEYRAIFDDPQLVHEIINLSGVFKVEILRFKEDVNLELLLIGRPESIDNFKFVFAFQCIEYAEIKALKMKNYTLRQEMYHQQGQVISLPNGLTPPRNFAEAVKSGIK